MTYFDSVPSSLRQTFSRIRRTSGGGQDSYGDATFTETTTTGYRGFFQYATTPGETVILSGHEVSYDAIVFTGGTTVVSERDLIVFGSSTSTAVSTRYQIQGVRPVYERGTIDHKELYVKQETL